MFQFQNQPVELRWREAGGADHVVCIGRFWRQGFQDCVAAGIAVRAVRLRRRDGHGFSVGRDTRTLGQPVRPEVLQNVGGVLDQLRAVADQPMAAPGQRVVDGARQRKDLAALFRGQSRRNQRTAAIGGLYNKCTEA